MYFFGWEKYYFTSCRDAFAFIHSATFYYIELRIEAGNVGHLNLVRNVPWALGAMKVVFPIQSLVDDDWFLSYNIGELAVTSEANIVPVSTAFTIVRC